jgi:tetratricopeptide (TPR) repeat protein
MSHYTEDQLSDYALRREAVNDARTVEEHLAGCPECRRALDLIETFDEALRDPLPWELADAMSARRGAPPELLAKARALAQEDAHARRIVMPLVDSPIRFREAGIDSDPRFFTLAVIRLLCTVANQTHEHQPQFSLMIADTALAISAKLPEPSRAKAAWCTGTAWKERANALRYLGRFREAETALDEAEKAFRVGRCPEPFDLAIVSYVRATVYCAMERFDDAIATARIAAKTFYEYGDTRRYLSALMAEGLGYYCADRDLESARLMELVANSAREADEIELLPRALANAANSYTRLHDYERAADLYAEALRLLQDLRLPTEEARVSWAIAALKLEMGAYEEGLAALEMSRSRLRQLGMANDSALATLDLVAGLIALGSSDRVPDLCRSISLTFSSEGMMRSAKKALAYLAEAVAQGHATPESVRHVRTYLERLPTHPHEEFQQIQ